MKFDWDENKNRINIKKHGISFEEAAFIFSDFNAISLFDEEHSQDEDRYITIGKIKIYGIIVVIQTERIESDIEYIRIISARKAVVTEKNEYNSRLGGK